MLAAGAAAGGDPKGYVLQAQDMPGYSLERGGYFSAQGATEPVRGYEADYTQPGVLHGLIRVASKAVVLSSPAAARDLLSALYARPPQVTPPFRRLPVSWQLGDESRVYLQSGTGSSGYWLAVYLVMWRSGRIVESMNGGGISGTFNLSRVAALARKQQARARIP